MNVEAPRARAIFLGGPGSLEPRPSGRPYLDGACGGDAALRATGRGPAPGPSPRPAASSRRPGRRLRPCRRAARRRRKRRARRSAPTSCWSRSAKGAWASSTWPSRRSPVRRKVALKIIKPGMDTRQVIARFEAERQALALMDHPNIARVLDAGATESGRPYFVMELVRGIPITDYCDREPARRSASGWSCSSWSARPCSTPTRRGSSTATSSPRTSWSRCIDGVPVPKVIDFGVAKATGAEPHRAGRSSPASRSSSARRCT